MTANNFYIHLASNTKNELNFKNTIGNFVTKLRRKINLDDQWEVALTEISYTKSWYNIFEDQKITLQCKSFANPAPKIIKAGNYDIETIFYKINNVLSQFRKSDLCEGDGVEDNEIDPVFSPKISYDKHTKRVRINLGKLRDTKGNLLNVYPVFSELLLDMLGLSYTNTNSQRFDYKTILGSNLEQIENIKDGNVIENFGEVNMNAGIHSIYLYCDLIQPVLVGHSEVKLLRNVEIPNDLKFGDQVDIKYQTPYYYPISRNEFDTIEIDIKDDTNRQIDFAFGKTTLTLHFRRSEQNVNESIYKLLH